MKEGSLFTNLYYKLTKLNIIECKTVIQILIQLYIVMRTRISEYKVNARAEHQ